MGLFDFFRKKDGNSIHLPPGISLSDELLPHWPLIEKSKLDFIEIKTTANDNLGIMQSKFAGPMYLPIGFPYPVDQNFKHMFPLAQINFSEVPPLPGYPEKGILEFYISDNNLYGLDFNDQTEQKDFRVFYFEHADEKSAETDFSFLDDIDFEYVPITRQLQLHFSKARDYAGISDVRFEKNFGTGFYNWTERFGDKEEAIFDEMCESFSNWGHKIGGYADFTQEDPRYDSHEDWILLLQISSADEFIMWGDVGICNFFIHPDDLKRKDFSRVMYNWDCS